MSNVQPKEFIVYMATNRLNGKRYIGATSRRLEVRQSAHFRDAKAKRPGCRIFNAAIRKYGEDVFVWTVLATTKTFDDLMKEEIRLIAQHRPEYNITKGGQGLLGVTRSPEWREKMSKINLGRKPTQATKDKTKATRARLYAETAYVGPMTQQRLKDLLHYDGKTGEFRWKKSNNQHRTGTIAGNLQKNGYVRIVVDGQKYLAHSLAWLYETGCWPTYKLYHKNRCRSDNRISNLRHGTLSQLSAAKSVSTNNLLGIKGVRLHECGKYTARIMKDHKPYYLGLFDTAQGAATARAEKERELFGEFARV